MAGASPGEQAEVLSQREVAEFQEKVYRFYRVFRRDLPWRNTHDAYSIFVSEMMLQQTQVERVLERYSRFIVRFPDFSTLAEAPFPEVLGEWKGLGYNRRAIFLHRIARLVIDEYEGRLPDDETTLMSFPGIGEATAASLVAFVFNRPSIVIETNVRRVFLHHFFEGQSGVKDTEIRPFVAVTCDRESPREWYYALMDLGSALKKQIPNPNRRSAHYRKQAPFEGSDRMVRGRILGILVRDGEVRESDLPLKLGIDPQRAEAILATLEKEGFLKREGERAVLL
ncbi:MAG TPA: A/G-specific adenine glycosylase [Methanolinea sp.]|nr:A/G-specific adenine glycosylase [Methanolinea sp.]HQK55253.1 A/G-specific adenine glycosylase [Methanolinea sp.]